METQAAQAKNESVKNSKAKELTPTKPRTEHSIEDQIYNLHESNNSAINIKSESIEPSVEKITTLEQDPNELSIKPHLLHSSRRKHSLTKRFTPGTPEVTHKSKLSNPLANSEDGASDNLSPEERSSGDSITSQTGRKIALSAENTDETTKILNCEIPQTPEEVEEALDMVSKLPDTLPTVLEISQTRSNDSTELMESKTLDIGTVVTPVTQLLEEVRTSPQQIRALVTRRRRSSLPVIRSPPISVTRSPPISEEDDLGTSNIKLKITHFLHKYFPKKVQDDEDSTWPVDEHNPNEKMKKTLSKHMFDELLTHNEDKKSSTDIVSVSSDDDIPIDIPTLLQLKAIKTKSQAIFRLVYYFNKGAY
jgi:hypothetical protein